MATTDIRVNLGLEVDNKRAIASINGVKTAFDQVAGAAGKADQVGGLPNTQRQLSAIRSTLATFRQLLVAYAAFRVGGAIIGNITQAIDKFTLLDARMKAAAGSTAKAAQAYQQLASVSRETAVPVADLANFFARTSDAVLQYGQAGVTAVDLTRSVALGLKASGASASEAASAFLQFSQAINSGRLAGEEFRAIYEAAPRLVQAYAKALGISVGRLYELSKAQQLTTDKLINSTQEVNRILAEEAGKVPATIASSVESVRNAFGRILAEGANVSGVVATITTGLKFLEENASAVLKALIGMTSGAVIGGLLTLANALRAVGIAGAFAALASGNVAASLAIFVGGLAIVGGIAAAAGAFDGLAEATDNAAKAAADFEAEQKKLNDALATAEIRLVDTRKALEDFDREQSVEGLKKSVEEANKALQFQRSEVDRLRDSWADALKSAETYRKKAEDIRKEAIFKGRDRARAALPEDKAQLDASVEYGTNYFKLQRLTTEIADLARQGDTDSLRAAKELGKEAETLAKRQEDLVDQVKASDAASAARRIGEQTAKLYEALALVEDAQAAVSGTAADEAERQFFAIEESLGTLKAKIEEIKDTDLRLKRITLVEQLDAAIRKVDELQGKLAGLQSLPEETRGIGVSPFEGEVELPDYQKGIGADDAWAKMLERGRKVIEQRSTAEPIQATAEIDFSKATAGDPGIFAGEAININTQVDATQLQSSIQAAAAEAQQNVPTITIPVIAQPQFTDDGRQIISANAAFAAGGGVTPPNGVDNLLGWFNKDEFVMRAAAVRKYGAGFMHAINSLRFPAFAQGGMVSAGTPVNIHLPGGQSFGLTAQPSVAKQLASILSTEVLKRGRR